MNPHNEIVFKDAENDDNHCFKHHDCFFSNSLIIHEEKTKEITTVKEVWICDPNYHKIRRSFALIFSKNYQCFEKLYQTLERVFHQISKHFEVG